MQLAQDLLFSQQEHQALRMRFPILHQTLNGKPLVYFDNAATTQKPQAVIDALSNYYALNNANIHRGLHTLAERATADYEATRTAVQAFINAPEREEIVFTRGTTEGINLVASALGSYWLQPGDEVLISTMEHHSNIVPWQLACQRSGAALRVMPINDQGEIILEEALKLVNERTRVVAMVYVSNALGTINPVEELIGAAHSVGALTLVDAAQAASHMKLDVQALDTDFLVFSSHKVYGPTGIGVLYGRRSLLEEMPPYQGGGEMIAEVAFDKTTYNELPYKFEAGTPNIADTVAFRAALEFVQEIGLDRIAAWEDHLLQYGAGRLAQVPGFRPIGTAARKVSVISFLLEGTHPQDVGLMLDNYGIAVRTGNHCTQPLMARFCIPGTIRASMAVYNTTEEIDALAEALIKIKRMLG